MNCRSAEHLFSSFVEDELSQRERRALESHLAECPRCSRAVEELRATVDLLAALPSYETGPAFEEEVMDRIRSGEALRPSVVEWISERLGAAWLRPAFLAGAAACALYIAFTIVPPYLNHDPSGSGIARTPDATAPAATPVPATAGSNVAAEPSAPAGDVVASAPARDARPGPAANADLMASDVSGSPDSAGAMKSAPYQDEYILDQFYLNRSAEDGVHSIVPVSGRPSDDVYITF